MTDFKMLQMSAFVIVVTLFDLADSSVLDSVVSRHDKTNSIVSVYLKGYENHFCECNYYVKSMDLIGKDSLLIKLMSIEMWPAFENSEVIMYDSLCPDAEIDATLKVTDELIEEFKKYSKMKVFYDSIENVRTKRITRNSDGKMKFYMRMTEIANNMNINFYKLPSVSGFWEGTNPYVCYNINNTFKCVHDGLEYEFTTGRFPVLVDLNKISK